MMLSTVYRNVA
jgi:hypothetical protein